MDGEQVALLQFFTPEARQGENGRTEGQRCCPTHLHKHTERQMRAIFHYWRTRTRTCVLDISKPPLVTWLRPQE